MTADTTPSLEELRAESEALTKALTGLTCGGSEFFTRKGDRFVADIPACQAYVRKLRDGQHDLLKSATRKWIDAAKRAEAAEANTRRLEEAAGPFLKLAAEVINPVGGERPWHADSQDWMVVFGFAGQTLTLGDLRRAAALTTKEADRGPE